MQRVKLKLFTSWGDDDKYTNIWKSRLMPLSGIWKSGDMELEWTNNAAIADYHVVMNSPADIKQYQPHKGILLRMEPTHAKNVYGDFLNPSSSIYRYLYDVHNAIEWHLERNFDQLTKDLLPNNSITKTKVLSTITSGIQTETGHKLRYAFLSYLEELKDFDFYGRHPSTNKAYRGPLPSIVKDGGLLDYKYTFAAENCEENGYFTEKIVDAILCECLCFYWGCPDIDKFIDPRCFIKLDLHDPVRALQVVKDAIKNDEYSKRLPFIRAEKNKIINQLQVMPTLVDIIKQINKQDKLYDQLFNNKLSKWRLLPNKDSKQIFDEPGIKQALLKIYEDNKDKFGFQLGSRKAIKFDDGSRDNKFDDSNVIIPTNIGDTNPITIVTAFFSVSKATKQKREDAIEDIKRFAKIDCHMVIFTDLTNYQLLKSLRNPHNTRIYLKELSEFSCAKYRQYWDYCYNIDRETYHSSDLYMVWAERHLTLVNDAISVNPWKSDYFFWVDIGSIRNPNAFPTMSDDIKGFPSYDKVKQLVPINKFVLCIPNRISRQIIKAAGGNICSALLNTVDGKSCSQFDGIQGGFQGGHKHMWKMWSELYLKHLMYFVNSGTYGGKDQAIMTNIYVNDPDKFILFKGESTWNGKIIDPWYTSLYRFSGATVINGLVSVIIPSYQRFNNVKAAIDSVLKQSYQPLEIIVVNDASPDVQYKQLDALYSGKNVKIIHLPVNMRVKHNVKSAQGATRNEGIKIARGKYIAFLDDDDCYVDADKIFKQVNVLKKYPQAKICCTNMLKGNGSNHDTVLKAAGIHDSKIYPNMLERGVFLFDRQLILQHNYISNSTVLVERDILEAVNNFKPEPYEDYRCWLRILERTNAIYLQQPMVWYDNSHLTGTHYVYQGSLY